MKITTKRTGKKLSDSIAIPIKCPHCGHKITLKPGGLKRDPLLTCPSCRKKTQIDSGGTLRKTADELASLDRAWGRLFK
jgi:transposase-like protein